MDLFLEGGIQNSTLLSSVGGSRKESGSFFRTSSLESARRHELELRCRGDCYGAGGSHLAVTFVKVI